MTGEGKLSLASSLGGARVAAGQDTIAAAFAASSGRAALMPYLMGGFPSVEASRAAIAERTLPARSSMQARSQGSGTSGRVCAAAGTASRARDAAATVLNIRSTPPCRLTRGQPLYLRGIGLSTAARATE